MQAAVVKSAAFLKRSTVLPSHKRRVSCGCSSRLQRIEGSSVPRHGHRTNSHTVRGMADAMKAAPMLWGGFPTAGALERLAAAEEISVKSGEEASDIQPTPAPVEVEQVEFVADSACFSGASRFCLAFRSGYINPYQVESLLRSEQNDCYT